MNRWSSSYPAMSSALAVPFGRCIDDLERLRQVRETLRHQLRCKGKPGWKSIKPPRTIS